MKKEWRQKAQGLSRNEMKKIKGGSDAAGDQCMHIGCLLYVNADTGYVWGKCDANSNGNCVCDARETAGQSVVTSQCKVGGIIAGVPVVGGPRG